jgi:DNA invertase Pin-like site-specific DNA recombinase
MLIGYARISTADTQSTLSQRRTLEGAGCERIFEETGSGARSDRPELLQMLEGLRPGDVLVVYKIDRLSRSLKDMLLLLERVEAAGAGFRSLTESIDTTTPAGRMMLQLLGVFAEFERAMIRERTLAGLAAARAAGRVGGTPRKLTAEQRADIVDQVISGRQTGAEMGRRYGMSRAYASQLCAPFRATPPQKRVTKLTPEQKEDIVRQVLSGARKQAEMARLYGVSTCLVSKIVNAQRERRRSSAEDAAELYRLLEEPDPGFHKRRARELAMYRY